MDTDALQAFASKNWLNFYIMKKILTFASVGSHWVQLLRLSLSFSHCDAVYMSINPDYQIELNNYQLKLVDLY